MQSVAHRNSPEVHMKRMVLGTSASLVLLIGASACRPRPAAVDGTSASAANRVATMFTDTALFRRLCVEADSGISPEQGRCTPRDQGLQLIRLIPRPEPQRRMPPQ
jgi:hypothetical protein